MRADEIIVRPLLTEKSNALREIHKYCFVIDARANKIMVMSAVKELFNVHPVSCNIVNVGGKPRRVRNRSGYTSNWKKAIVTLNGNEKIQIFEGA
jgi:large subunit ribosomal protein L23